MARELCDRCKGLIQSMPGITLAQVKINHEASCPSPMARRHPKNGVDVVLHSDDDAGYSHSDPIVVPRKRTIKRVSPPARKRTIPRR